jgi:Lantibiotic biosynthesis dehydratase C-term
MRWHSLHVHYYDQAGVDALILDAVRPFFASVRGQVEAAYFVRHWRRGPHLRLNLRSDAAAFAHTVYPAAEEIVGGFLTAEPSRAAPDPARHLRLHRQLAALEHDDGPLLPWRPDNSLQVVPYDRRLHVLGGEAAADLLAAFLSGTTELTFQMTDHMRTRGHRLGLAFDLMLAVAHAFSGSGIVAGFASFRSHAEAFLCAWPGAGTLREAWDRHYRSRAPALVQRVRDVVTTLDGETPGVPFVASWTGALAGYHARGRTLIETGQMTMEPPAPAGRSVPTVGPLSEVSPFHRATYGSDRYTRDLRPSLWFAAYRLALNYTYLQLTRLGLAPADRFFLCHLAANAVEELYGISAMELVRESPQPQSVRRQDQP